MQEEDKLAEGFDRGIDFNDMKDNLIEDYVLTKCKIEELKPKTKSYAFHKKVLFSRLIYCLIAMIQLRNGSRIIEACTSFPMFLLGGLDNKVVVRIAKSKCIKYKKETGEKYLTKTRFRKMIFPSQWIDIYDEEEVKKYFEEIKDKRLAKRVLDYLLLHHKCNTHSLRYAFINYMLYEKKKEMTIVAKFIGHSNVMQLVRYSQNKQAEKLFDENI
jgi:hypothetical protein